jgi:hypothetical protein
MENTLPHIDYFLMGCDCADDLVRLWPAAIAGADTGGTDAAMQGGDVLKS